MPKQNKNKPLSEAKREEFAMTIDSTPSVKSLSFHDDDNKMIGEITWDDGELKFKGKYKKSAKVFFKWFRDYLEEDIKSLLNKQRVRDMDEMMGEIEKQIDKLPQDDYGAVVIIDEEEFLSTLKSYKLKKK